MALSRRETGNLVESRSLQAAVVDSCPASKEGIEASLRASGIFVHDPEDPVIWLCDGSARIVVLTLRAADDWPILEQLGHTHLPVVVVVSAAQSAGGAYRRALSLGATAVVPEKSPTAVIVGAVRAAAVELALVPAALLKFLALDAAEEESPNRIHASELKWLAQLADGATVAELAAKSFCSERSMHRHLSCLYQRLGVQTRHEAIAWFLKRDSA
jgi:DNA-binding NarL/FixJ family response regulator